MWRSFQIFSTLVSLISFTIARNEYNNYANIYERQRNVQFVCRREGYHEDPNDCRIFYRCVDWGDGRPMTAFKHECGEGTVFSSSKGNICTYPWDSGRPECSENEVDSDLYPESGSAIPECTAEGWMEDPNDCARFYRCVDLGHGHFQRYPFTCGAGTVWDQGLETCNHPWAVDREECRQNYPGLDAMQSLKPSNKPALDESLNSPGSSEPSVSLEPPEPPGSMEFPGSPSSPEAPGFAESPGSPNFQESPGSPSSPGSTGLTNIPGSSGTPSILRPPNTSGSPESPGTLDTPGSSIPSDISDSPDVPGFQSTGNSVGLLDPSKLSEPPIKPTYLPATAEVNALQTVPFSCFSEGFFPHPTDCHKFYRCVGGASTGYRKFEFVCGPGTAWDDGIQTCNYEDQVESCFRSSDKMTAAPTGTTEGSSGTTAGSSGTTVGSSGTTAGPSGTTGKPSETTKGPSETSGTTTSISTTSAKPVESTVTSKPTQSSQGMTPTKPEHMEMPVTSTENTAGPSPSEPSTESKQNCTTPKLDADIVCTEEGFKPYPHACEKFYRCVNNGNGFNVYHFTCPIGTIFDPSINVCNHPESIYPQRDCTAQSESSTISTPVTVSNTPEKVTVPMETSTSSTTTTEAPSPTTTVVTESSTVTTEKTVETSTGEQTTESATEPSTATESTTSSSIETTTEVASTTEDGSTTMITTSTMESTSTTETASTTQTISTTTEAASTPEVPSTTMETGSTIEEGSTLETSSTTEAGSTTEEEDMTVTSSTTETGSTTEASTIEAGTTTETGSTTEAGTGEESTTVASTTEAGITTETESSTTTTENTSETTESNVTTETSGTSTVTESTSGETSETTTIATETTQSSPTTTQSTSQESTLAEMQTPTTTPASTSSQQPEVTTESQNTTRPVIPPGAFPCPIPNLSGDQFVLACPSGFRRYPRYCNLFYQCIVTSNMEVKILVFSCPKDTIFDETKIQCLSESQSNQTCETSDNKPRVYRAVSDTPTASIEVSNQPLCPSEGHFPYREGCSNTFFKCTRGSNRSLQGYLYKCPMNFVYWSVSRRCERTTRLPMCNYIGNKNETESLKSRLLNNLPVEYFNISAKKLHI